MSHLRRALSLTTALTLVVVGAVLAPPATADDPPPPPVVAEPEQRLLVFSKTAAFRHGSIPDGIAALETIGEANGIAVDTTEDSAAFTPENLAQYDAVAFMSTTGDVLDDGQQDAFEDYVRGGGGYVGVHAASDTEYSWPWYGELVGAYFAGHPAVQEAGIHVEDRTHPSTAHLPQRWERTDEWYNFGDNPRGDVHVLMTLDETSYEAGGGAMGADHPIAWCQYHEGGRSWYTGLGHTPESFVEPAFVEHLTGGVLWAVGAASNDCGGTVDANYQKVVLDDDVASPMGLQVAPDGRVLYIERAGQVRVIDPETSTTSTAGRLQVHSAQENGLLGIELDPDFADNGWVYLFYSPDSDLIESPHQRLSRFTLEDDTLDMASEQILLQIPHQREQCCHSGGYLDFDADGNLWISTGDDSSPGGAPGGYAPIDERPGQEAMDAQRSSANTNDLRGKLLRITPTDDGSYTVPAGNLVDTEWAAGQDSTKIRPEIYVMGLRNPFRFAVDQTTGAVYLGDYGPDASVADARGIDGRVEWNVITEPGNYGWPYCHGGGAYVDYDYATSTPGAEFDCSAPVNDSPNNTGVSELPPVVDPLVAYGRSLRDPDVGTGGAPMGGPAYVFDEDLESDRRWPRSMADKPFFYEWGQNRLYQLHLDEDGARTDVTRVLASMGFVRPHAMVFGEHDGAMYLIEWGAGFGGNNPDSQVVRVDYTGGNDRPLAKATATPRSGGVPLEVEFSSAGTAHPQGADLTYAWDFGDGATSTDPNPTHTYTEEGDFTAVLTVTDVQGRTGTANVTISAGNTEPVVDIRWPANGTVFTYGDTVEFDVAVTDAEDGSTTAGDVDCSDVTVELILGHDDHGHPMKEATGCTGSFVLEEDSGHTDTDRITYAIEARYTDGGSPEGTVAPLTGRDVVAMQPSRKQAEHYSLGTEVRSEATADPMGGDLNVGFIRTNSAMTFDDFNFANVDALRFRVASPNATSRIEIHKDTADGDLLGSVAVPSTGGFQSWGWVEAAVDDPGGTFDLVLTFTGGDGYLLNLNWFDVLGEGAAGGPPVDIPTPTAQLAPADPVQGGWYREAVSLTLTSEAGDAIEYQVGDGAWTPYDAPVTFADDDRHEVAFRAVRGEDTSNRGSVVVQVDGTDPTTTTDLVAQTEGETFTGDVVVTLDAQDATSGVEATTVRVDGGDEVAYDGPFTVTGDGDHTVQVRSTDAAGNVEEWRTVRFASPSGQRPQVSLSEPPRGGVVPFGQAVRYTADVGDPEADCADVRARLVVTGGDRTWRGEPTDGCTGLVTMVRPDDAGPTERLRYEVEVLYARGGHDGEVRNLEQARASVRVQPSLVEAEHADSTVRTEATGDSLGGGLNVGWLRTGATISYEDVNLAGIDAIRFRLASSSIGGTLELRQNTAGGALLGSTTITNTGGGQSYRWFEAPVTDPGEPFTLVLVFTATGSHYIANINMFEFVGDGVSTDPAPAELAVSTQVVPRCLAGKVYLAVRATNEDSVRVDVTLTTPFGTRTVADVAPGASAYQSFATRSVSVAAGTATVSAQGDGRTFAAEPQYAALDCG